MEQRFQALKDKDYGQVMVISQTGSFGVPTSAYCKEVRSQYGLTFPVLYDPTGQLGGALGYGSNSNDRSTVLSEGMVIEFQGKFANQNSVQGTLEGLLQ